MKQNSWSRISFSVSEAVAWACSKKMLVSTYVQSSIEAHWAFDPKHTASKAKKSWRGPRYGTTAFVL